MQTGSMTPSNRFSLQGFSLIEVLVALFVLSIGLLGLAAMQTMALTADQGGYLRSQAVILAYDLLDRIRANPLGMANSMANENYDQTPFPTSYPTDCTTAACSYSDLATYDLVKWKGNVTNMMPSGNGTISVVGGSFTITITWDDRSNPDSAAQSFSNTVRLL